MKKVRPIAPLVLIAVVLFAVAVFNQSDAYAAHEIYLRDVNGVPVGIGSNTPYSPKQSCGLVNCHIDMVKSFGMASGNIYESGTGYADKEESGSSYSVPYPVHGVSAGFHFQTGRSSPWGPVQRDYYDLFAFTSSPGMYGKYCASAMRRLAGPNETDAGFDMSSYDFAHSECGWCHAGGGPLEYDRDGYRYDGVSGLFRNGANPDPKRGDYYTFDAATGSIVSRINEWQTGGVAEVDCMVCHLKTTIDGFRFSMLERNFGISDAESPGFAASLGLAGPAGTTGILSIARRGDAAANPDVSRAGWSWTTNLIDISTMPDKENCALCHFSDKSLMTTGPAGLPLGYTVMQKKFPTGTADDGDIVGGGKNSNDWFTFTLRADSGKAGGSINDALNGDAHMDKGRQCSFCHNLLGTARDYSYDCASCHYDIWGYPAPPEVTPVSPQVFPALTDASGNTVQPSLEVLRIDHQFAKGNSKPNGMLLDQLDNTVTCEGCHIDKTHQNAGAAPIPTSAHASIPAFHFARIDCRACHIPMLSGPIKKVLDDFSAGPFGMSGRSQIRQNPSGSGNLPLSVWRPRDPDGGRMRITPVSTLATAFWAGISFDGSPEPVSPETARRAAEAFRESQGSADGIYTWTLNSPQNGDSALIVNTQAEISGMVEQLKLLGVSEPVLTLTFDQFAASHNGRTRLSATILGSPSGGGCIMCHSSSDPSSPNYSSKSAGFFERAHTLFEQPQDGGSGLVQTETAGPGGNLVKRVDARFVTRQSDGSALVFDLSGADGQTVENTINQADVLGFDQYYLEYLLNPQTGGVTPAKASFAWTSDAVVLNQVNLDASSSVCSGDCTYSWDFGDGEIGRGLSTQHIYGSAGYYPVSLTVEDSLYGFTSASTVTVEAKSMNTAPAASKTTPVVSGMTVSFTDTSSDNQDLQSSLVVTVAWGDGTSSTGAGGQMFSKTYGLAGSYTIRHSVRDTGGLVSASPNATVSISAKYSISGTIRDGGGNPLPAATVYLKAGTTVKKIATTPADGSYSFTNLLTGCFIVQPSMAGKTFSPLSQKVCVGPSRAGIDFTAL